MNFGFINVLKPTGMTSHDVVARVRRFTKIKRSGHGGTLDPMAEGVLPMAFGQACRLIDYLPSDKTYYGEILLGKKTTTDDLEGEVVEEGDTTNITDAQIENALAQFRGQITQHPPVYSAIRIGGQHLYDLARKGNAPEKAPAREVHVHQLDLVSIKSPVVAIRVKVSKGTYIRSIARDLGDALGCGGCLSKLVREQAGRMNIEEAHSLDDIKNHADKNDLESIFTDLADALEIQKVEVVESDSAHIFNGRAIELPRQYADPLLLATLNGRYICLLKRLESGDQNPQGEAPHLFKPEVVFSDARPTS